MTAPLTRRRRHDRILEQLQRDGEVLVTALAERFAVDVVTVRRDLAHLERAGLLRRSRGGAIPSRGGTVEFALQRKQQTRAAEKAAIADAAAAMVRPGMAVSLDTGTTTLEVARRIAGVTDLKVLTSSLAIAAVLYPHDNIELVLLGGVARKGSPDLIGMLTEENLRRFRVHACILGADALSPDGLFTTDVGIARVSQAMLAGAETAILVADSSKFETTAFVQFASWDAIGHVVTDAGVSAAARGWLERVVPKVTYAPVTSRQGSGHER